MNGNLGNNQSNSYHRPEPIVNRNWRVHDTAAAPVGSSSKHVQYSEQERQNIQGQLDKVLGPEYVSFRPGGAGLKVSYIEGWKVLNLANEIFGFNGWNSELISSQVDYFDVGTGGRISMGLAVVVRITLKDGTYHEDFGYGYIENAKNKAMAFEKCRKEAFTDGLKRCLRCFGNVLGNCLYDRGIISKIQKVRLPPPEVDSYDFYRDPLIVKREAHKKNTCSVNIHEGGQLEGVIPKSEVEAVQGNSSTSKATLNLPISDNNSNAQEKGASLGGENNHGHHQIAGRETPDPRINKDDAIQEGSRNEEPSPKNVDIVNDFDDSLVFSDDIQVDDELSYNDGMDDYDLQMLLHKNRRQFRDDANINSSARKEKSPGSSDNNDVMNNTNKHIPEQTAFFSAKSADIVKQPLNDISDIPQFDPKYVSPSVRRTLDHNKSVPIKKKEVSRIVNEKRKPLHPTQSANIDLDSTTDMSNANTATLLGKRMIGVPPSQRSHKRLHKK